jgi:hypothetical protein
MKKFILLSGSIIIATLFIFILLKSSLKIEKTNPEVFLSAVKTADSLQRINPFFTGYDFHEWELKTGKNFIRYSQDIDKDNQDEWSVGEIDRLDFIFLEDSTILARLSTLYSGYITFDTTRAKIYDSIINEERFFVKDDDFKKKFKALISDRAKKINSREDIDFKEYFPALRL